MTSPNSAPIPVQDPEATMPIPVAQFNTPPQTPDILPQRKSDAQKSSELVNARMEAVRNTFIISTEGGAQHEATAIQRDAPFTGLIRSQFEDYTQLGARDMHNGEDNNRGAYTHMLIETGNPQSPNDLANPYQRILITRTSAPEVMSATGREPNPATGDPGEEGQTFTLIDLDKTEGAGSVHQPQTITSEQLRDITLRHGEPMVLGADANGESPRTNGTISQVVAFKMDQHAKDGRLAAYGGADNAPPRVKNKGVTPLNQFGDNLEYAMKAARFEKATEAAVSQAVGNTALKPIVALSGAAGFNTQPAVAVNANVAAMETSQQAKIAEAYALVQDSLRQNFYAADPAAEAARRDRLANVLNDQNTPGNIAFVKVVGELQDVLKRQIAEAPGKGKSPDGITYRMLYDQYQDMYNRYSAAPNNSKAKQALPLVQTRLQVLSELFALPLPFDSLYLTTKS